MPVPASITECSTDDCDRDPKEHLLHGEGDGEVVSLYLCPPCYRAYQRGKEFV